MKKIQTPHYSVLINIHEVMAHKFVFALSTNRSLIPTKLK